MDPQTKMYHTRWTRSRSQSSASTQSNRAAIGAVAMLAAKSSLTPSIAPLQPAEALHNVGDIEPNIWLYCAAEQKNPVELLMVYFGIARIFRVFPVEVNWTGMMLVVKESTMISKVICGIVCFFNIFSETTRFLRHVTFNKPQELNPITYFEVAQFLAAILYSTCCIYTIWRTLRHLQPIIDVLQKSQYGLANYYPPGYSRTRYIGFSVLFLVLTFANILSFVLINLRRYGWSWCKSYMAWADIFYHQFFIDYWLPVGFYPILKHVAGSCGLLMISSSLFVYNFSDWLPFCFALILNAELDGFKQMIARDKVQPLMHEVVRRYESILLLSKRINLLIGVSVFGFGIARIPDFIFIFLSFLSPPNLFVFMRQIFRLVNFFGFLLLATAVNNKCGDFEEWLNERAPISKLTQQELHILLHQAASKKIGIYGGRFFKISNGFLGSVVTTFLTFAIIILQFKSSHTNTLVECWKYFNATTTQS